MQITIEPGKIVSVNNPIGLRVAASFGWEFYDHYQIGIKLYYDKNHTSLFSIIPDMEARVTPDSATGYYDFNLSRMLKGIFSPDRPEWLTNTARFCTKNNFRFYAVVEEYANTQLINSITSNIFRVVDAGFSVPVGQYLETYVNSQKFLTHQPRNKRISTCQKEFLYFSFPSPGTYTLNADLEFEDGTTLNGYNTIAPSITTGSAFNIGLFPCGFEALGLDSFVAPKVSAYTVYLTGDKSERQRFEIDRTFHPNDRFYLFKNSLGGYDTLRATGRLAESENVSSVVSQKPLPVFYDATFGQIENVGTVSQGVFTQHTGILSSAGADWMKELFRTRDLVRIGDQFHNPEGLGEYWPIVLDQGTNKIREDEDFLYKAKFNYQDAFLNLH